MFKNNVEIIQEHCICEWLINFLEKTLSQFGSTYSLLQNEIVKFKVYINKNLA